MKNKEAIKQEIYELAKRISETSSEDSLFETARELYEKSILLKHASGAEPKISAKQEKPTGMTADESTQLEPTPVITDSPSQNASAEQREKQLAIDLFSAETPSPEIPSAPISAKSASEKGKETETKSVPPVPKEPIRSEKTSESVAERLSHKKITDLKSSIGINEKFQFINELFEGNMKEYNVAVDQINSFTTHTEAESYIANLEEVYKWQPDNHIAENFKELVERRFA